MREDMMKTIKISFRLTEKELLNMEEAMALENYRSRSKYIRKVLSERKVLRRNLKPVDGNMLKRAMILSSDIKKIGVNYNQVVKAINTAVSLKDKDGKSVLSMRRLEGQIAGLHKQMEKIVSLIQEFMEAVQ